MSFLAINSDSLDIGGVVGAGSGGEGGDGLPNFVNTNHCFAVVKNSTRLRLVFLLICPLDNNCSRISYSLNSRSLGVYFRLGSNWKNFSISFIL